MGYDLSDRLATGLSKKSYRTAGTPASHGKSEPCGLTLIRQATLADLRSVRYRPFGLVRDHKALVRYRGRHDEGEPCGLKAGMRAPGSLTRVEGQIGGILAEPVVGRGLLVVGKVNIR